MGISLTNPSTSQSTTELKKLTEDLQLIVLELNEL
jgi:hypothetical protein